MGEARTAVAASAREAYDLPLDRVAVVPFGANLDSQAKALGSEDWRPLRDYAEFSPPSDTPPLIQSAPAPSFTARISSPNGTFHFILPEFRS